MPKSINALKFSLTVFYLVDEVSGVHMFSVCVWVSAASDCKPYTERVLAAVKEGQFAVLLKQML